MLSSASGAASGNAPALPFWLGAEYTGARTGLNAVHSLRLLSGQSEYASSEFENEMKLTLQYS
jgi:hypothetical protein